MKLNILHTNDIHSNINNLAYGGSYIQHIRDTNEYTLLVDAGDMITGDFQFKYNQGQAELAISNYLKYDVVTVGNHDFDIDVGLPLLKKHMEGINATYVISNVRDNNGQLGTFQPTYIKEVNGVKIGFISFVLPSVIKYIDQTFDALTGIELICDVDEQAVVDSIRNQVDVLIALNHQGVDRDIELANKTNGIDIIISAHSHTELVQPIIVNNTYIVQTGCFGKNIGHLELELVDKQISKIDYHLQTLDASLGLDNQLQAIIDKYLSIANDQSSEVYGSCKHVLIGEREKMIKNSTNLGTLVCDSYLDYAKELGYNPDFAFINARGLRQNIDAGDITAKHLYNVMPFEKKLLIAEVRGADLIAGLSNKIELQTAGLKILKDDERKMFFDNTIDKPIEDNKIYQVATMDYVYYHHEFGNLRNGKLIASDIGLDTDIVGKYIKKLGHGFEYQNNMMVEYCEEV